MTYAIFGQTWPLVWIELLLVVTALCFAALAPGIIGKLSSPIERSLSKAAQRPWLAISIAAAAPLALRLLLLSMYPPPSPIVHDDFSYLLQADTFALGRVTNPTPPFWHHFESLFIFCTPTYNSQYEPAQALFLAAAKVITGQPWWGVYVGMGLLFGTVCWALGQCVPWRWALAGSLLLAMQFGVFGYWMNSYFGGGISATGGALIFGGLIRARKRRDNWALAVTALGFIIVAASRPAEALLWGVAGVLFLLPRIPPARALAPAALVLIAGVSGLLWYNWRVTGHALEPPYLHNLRLYGTPQPYFWQRPVTITNFRYPEFQDIYKYQRKFYDQRYSLIGLAHGWARRVIDSWLFYIGPVLLIPFFWLPLLWRDQRIRPWIIAIALFAFDHLTYHRWYPQHSAPEVVLLGLILVQCWRRVRLWQFRGTPVGRAFTELLPVCGFIGLVIPVAAKTTEPYLPASMKRIQILWQPQFLTDSPRDQIIRKLEEMGGKHLIFVHYRPDHNSHHEWVYNGADIPGSRIIWARQEGRQSDSALAAYFADHRAWILDADADPPRLYPFSQFEKDKSLGTPRQVVERN